MKNIKSSIYTFLIISLLLGCNKSSTKEESEDTFINSNFISISRDDFKARNFRLDSITKTLFPSVIRTNGVIDVPPNSKSTISAIIGGYVKNFPLLVGEQVRKGQMLLTIENLEFLELQQKFLETVQKMEFLEMEFGRQEELYAEKISSQKNYMKAKNDYENIKIQYQSLRQKLIMLNFNPDKLKASNLSSQTTIYAPLAGSVTQIFVNTGSHVSAQNPIMEIVNSDHLHLEIRVFEKDALRIVKGQKIEFRVPEYSDHLFAAEVHLIGKSIGEDRTVMVHAHLDEDLKEKFIPGMFVQADIFMDEKLQKALPEEAVIDYQENKYVLELIKETESSYVFKKTEIDPDFNYKGYVQLNSSFNSDHSKRYLSGDYTLDVN